MFLKSVEHAVPALLSYAWLDPDNERDKLPGRDANAELDSPHLAWTGESQAYWQGLQAMMYLLNDRTAEARVQFADRDVSPDQWSGYAPRSTVDQLLRTAVGRANALVNNDIVRRLALEAMPGAVWAKDSPAPSPNMVRPSAAEPATPKKPRPLLQRRPERSPPLVAHRPARLLPHRRTLSPNRWPHPRHRRPAFGPLDAPLRLRRGLPQLRHRQPRHRRRPPRLRHPQRRHVNPTSSVVMDTSSVVMDMSGGADPQVPADPQVGPSKRGQNQR